MSVVMYIKVENINKNILSHLGLSFCVKSYQTVGALKQDNYTYSNIFSQWHEECHHMISDTGATITGFSCIHSFEYNIIHIIHY